jgi:hypothetical protein
MINLTEKERKVAKDRQRQKERDKFIGKVANVLGALSCGCSGMLLFFIIVTAMFLKLL